MKIKTAVLVLFLSLAIHQTAQAALLWTAIYVGASEGTGKGFENYKKNPLLFGGELAFETAALLQMGVEYTHSAIKNTDGDSGYIGTLFGFFRFPFILGWSLKLGAGTGKSDLDPLSSKPIYGAVAGLANDFVLVPMLFMFRLEGDVRVIQPGGANSFRALLYDAKGGLVLSL